MNDGNLLLPLAVEGVAAEVRVVEGASGFSVASLAPVEFLAGSAAGELEVAEGLLDASNDFWEHRPVLLFLRRRALALPDLKRSGMPMTGLVKRMGISSIGVVTM